MRNIFKSLVAVLALGGVMVASAPAQARHDGYRNYRDYRGGYERHRFRHYDRHAYRDYRNFRGYPGGYYRYRGPPRVYYRDHYHGDAVAAGLIGLAIGAAIASSRDRDYDRGRYYDRDDGYYGD